jgi:chromate reductase
MRLIGFPRREELLSGKPVAIMGATSGRWGTRLAQAALRQTLYATEAMVLPKPGLYIAEAARVFDGQGRLADDLTAKALDRLLIAFQEWIELWSDESRFRGRRGAPPQNHFFRT